VARRNCRRRRDWSASGSLFLPATSPLSMRAPSVLPDWPCVSLFSPGRACRPSSPLLLARRFRRRHDDPALVLRYRLRFLDGDDVADLVLIGLVVGVILLRAADGLLQHRVREAALDADHHRLVVLVADHDALQDA